MDRSQAAEYARRGVLVTLGLIVILIPLAMTSATYAVCEPIKLTLLRVLSSVGLALFVLHLLLWRRLGLGAGRKTGPGGSASSGAASAWRRRSGLLLPWAALLAVGLVAVLRSIDFHTDRPLTSRTTVSYSTRLSV